MDFTKFLSLLESEKLYFTRSDRFDDPFEGAVPLSNVMARGNSIRQLFDEHKDIPDSAKMAIADWEIDKPDHNRATKKYVALNCWHMNEHESAAMWKLYLHGPEGIAIQSTYQQLRDSIIDEEPVQIGCVKYIDYEKDGFHEHTLFTAFVHKRKSFEHEREVRACIWKPPITANGLDYQLETIGQGLTIKVDIKSLIQKLYIAPTAQSWFAELAKSVMAKYGFDFEVVHSGLFSVPLF